MTHPVDKKLSKNFNWPCSKFDIIYRVSQKKVGSQKTSNCSNSLNFEAKINFNTIRQNDLKWRKNMHRFKITILRQLYSWRRIYLGPVCLLSIDLLLLQFVALLTRYSIGDCPAAGCAPFSYGAQFLLNCSRLSRLDRLEKFGDAELVQLRSLYLFKVGEES